MNPKKQDLDIDGFYMSLFRSIAEEMIEEHKDTETPATIVDLIIEEYNGAIDLERMIH